MQASNLQYPIIPRGPLPSPESTSPSDSESDMVAELEKKRRQVEEEVSRFKAQKEKELREFEQGLRTSRRRQSNNLPSPKWASQTQLNTDRPPSRSSSSTALDLLVNHGAPQKRNSHNVSKKTTEKPTQKKSSSKSSPSSSKPVVSLDRMNIQGENTSSKSSRPRTPPTPTLLSRTLTRSSSGSSFASSPPQPKNKSPPPENFDAPSRSSSPIEKHRNSLTGLFTPSYIELLDTPHDRRYQSSIALETPPLEDETATAPSSYKSSTVNEVLPLSSSSYPPHVTISPGGHSHASKRAYTAPTVSHSGMPSALRTVSGGEIGRKRKHVTFRLADSAIVEPSSSYEEGPSPQFDDDQEQPKKATSGQRSPVRPGKSSLSRTFSSDEEDAEAGVQPGMGMGDVIQRLNDFTIDDSSKSDPDDDRENTNNLRREAFDDDTAADDDDDDDDELPMEISTRRGTIDHEEDSSDKNLDTRYHEHEDEHVTLASADDGYFSPRNKHVSATDRIPRNNSSSMLFQSNGRAENPTPDKSRSSFEVRRRGAQHNEQRTSLEDLRISPQNGGTNVGLRGNLRHSVDGGSGVGFFELDEELASPDAGRVNPFELDTEHDIDDPESKSEDDPSLRGAGKKTRQGGFATGFGVGSVPINIVRPSASVSSSWVGTFGH